MDSARAAISYMVSCNGHALSFSPAGRTNNNLVQMATMMVLSKLTGSPVCIPSVLKPFVDHFDLAESRRSFCISNHCPSTTNITAEVSFHRRHPLLHAVNRSVFDDALALLLKHPKGDLRKELAPFCTVTAAVHVRNLEGSCERRLHYNRSLTPICNLTPTFVRDSLSHCSLKEVYVASDHQLPLVEQRLVSHFHASRYDRASSTRALLVDLMVLAIAAARDRCALLNPVSTFSRNALALRPSANNWCARSIS